MQILPPSNTAYILSLEGTAIFRTRRIRPGDSSIILSWYFLWVLFPTCKWTLPRPAGRPSPCWHTLKWRGADFRGDTSAVSCPGRCGDISGQYRDLQWNNTQAGNAFDVECEIMKSARLASGRLVTPQHTRRGTKMPWNMEIMQLFSRSLLLSWTWKQCWPNIKWMFIWT